MLAPHAPRGFAWSPTQSAVVALAAVALAFAPARCERALPPRDVSADPRGPGTMLLYGDRVEVNAATAEDFAALPGLGPAISARIVAARTRAGGFCSLEELRDVAELGAKKWPDVEPWVSVRPAPRCPSSSRE